MPIFNVTIPIAGHAIVEVFADDQNAAIEKALENIQQRDIESWEALSKFNQGNVCYCPKPWEIEIEEVEE
jgi:hypothetical protein